jgi:hypothetical protein
MKILYNPWLDQVAILVTKLRPGFSLLEYVDGTRFESFDELIKLAGWKEVGDYG